MESAHFVSLGWPTSECRHEDAGGGSGDTRPSPLTARAIRWPPEGKSLCTLPAYPCSVIPSPPVRQASFGGPWRLVLRSQLGLVLGSG